MPHHRSWSADEDRRLIENYNANELTIAELAAGTGRKVDTVRARLDKLRSEGKIGRRNPGPSRRSP